LQENEKADEEMNTAEELVKSLRARCTRLVSDIPHVLFYVVFIRECSLW